jgi:DNA-binding NarL/FixJ family response regulator
MTSTPTRVRVLLADDQTLFRIGLAGLLADDPRVDVVGQAADGLEAVALAGSLKPDVVLMDLKMPNLDGIAATERIIASHPGIRVLLLTTFETDGQIIHALKAGASGYVLKDSTVESIVSSLVAVMTGERVMASAVANRVLEMLTGITGPKDFYNGLTGRELEVLKLVAGGLANKQIAYTLKISDKTVRNHMSNLYEKLDVRDRSTAVLYAVRKGLVEV